MEIKNLRYFFAITKCGSFSKAAESVFLTQPALSQAIKVLEKDLGCQLIVRGRSIALTPAGTRLKEQCLKIFNLLEDTRNDLAQMEEGLSGTIRLVVYESLLLFVLPEIISSFSEQYPKVQFEFAIKGSLAAEKGILDGEHHFGLITRKPSSLKIEGRVLKKYSHNLMVSSKIQGKSSELMRDLPLFLLGNWQKEVLEKQTDLFQRFPEVRVLNPVNHVAVVRQFVSQGLGMAVLPDFTDGKDLRILESFPKIHLSMFLVRKPRSVILKAAERFMDHIRESMSDTCQ